MTAKFPVAVENCGYPKSEITWLAFWFVPQNVNVWVAEKYDQIVTWYEVDWNIIVPENF